MPSQYEEPTIIHLQNVTPNAYSAAKVVYLDYLIVIVLSKNKFTSTNKRTYSWKTPLAGRIKLNSDVTCFEDGSSGLGIIIHVSDGQTLIFVYK